MILSVKRVNRYFMLLTAPFLGLLIGLWWIQPSMQLDLEIAKFAPVALPVNETNAIQQDLLKAKTSASYTINAVSTSAKLYQETTAAMNTLVSSATTQASRPKIIYNRRITTKLGIPSGIINSDRITIELYRLNPGHYKAYALKIKLKDPTAMKMSLAKETSSGAETTMQAVKRYGAVAGINAGGFADQAGKRYPLSTTMIEGQYVYGFEPTYKDLSFIGLNKSGQLIGGKFNSRTQLDQLEQIGRAHV